MSRPLPGGYGTVRRVIYDDWKSTNPRDDGLESARGLIGRGAIVDGELPALSRLWHGIDVENQK